MTKQEEIREGLARLDFNRFNEVYMDGSIPKQCYKFADKIFTYLDSQGVVVKTWVYDEEKGIKIANIERLIDEKV